MASPYLFIIEDEVIDWCVAILVCLQFAVYRAELVKKSGEIR